MSDNQHTHEWGPIVYGATYDENHILGTYRRGDIRRCTDPKCKVIYVVQQTGYNNWSGD